MATTPSSIAVCPVCQVSVDGKRRTICPHCGNFYDTNSVPRINPARMVCQEGLSSGSKITPFGKRKEKSSSRFQSLANFFQNIGPGRRESIDNGQTKRDNALLSPTASRGSTGVAFDRRPKSQIDAFDNTSAIQDEGRGRVSSRPSADLGIDANLAATNPSDAAEGGRKPAESNRILNREQVSCGLTATRASEMEPAMSDVLRDKRSRLTDGGGPTDDRVVVETVRELPPPATAQRDERTQLPTLANRDAGVTAATGGHLGSTPASEQASTILALNRVEISSIQQLRGHIKLARERNSWDVVHCFYAITFSTCDQLNKTFKVDASKEYDTANDPGVNFEFLDFVYDELVKMPMNIQKTVLKAIVTSLLKEKDSPHSKDELRACFILIQNTQFIAAPTYVIFAHLLKQIATLSDQDHHFLVHWFKKIRSHRFKMLVRRLHRFVSVRLFPPKPDEMPPMTRCTWWIPSTVQVLALLNAANNLWNPRLVAIAEFYNKALDHIDLMAEYYSWQDPNSQRSFNFCQYPFVLSISAKRGILQRDSEQQMIVMARRSLVAKVQRRQMPDVTMIFLNLNVRRTHLVSDSLNEIARKQHDLKKKLKVTFSGEPGLDMGGLTKEWFQLLLRKVFRPEYGMFTYDAKSHKYWFNPAQCENYQEFNLVGVLMGLAVYNSIILDLHFPAVCYRKLLSPAVVPYDRPGATVGLAPVNLNTLQHVVPDLHAGLKQLLEYDGDVQEDFDISFQVSTTEFGVLKTTDLKEDGENIPVTNENRKEYVQLYSEQLLNRSVYEQFKAFYHGFHSVCASNALIMLRAEEVEMLVCGSPHLDMTQLQKVTVYEGYTADHQTIKNFWSIVLALRKDQQQRLLLFATGSDRVPIGGTCEIHFKLTKVENVSMLPVAYTCFNQLILPAYTRKKTLKEKLLIAIENAEGFGIE